MTFLIKFLDVFPSNRVLVNKEVKCQISDTPFTGVVDVFIFRKDASEFPLIYSNEFAAFSITGGFDHITPIVLQLFGNYHKAYRVTLTQQTILSLKFHMRGSFRTEAEIQAGLSRNSCNVWTLQLLDPYLGTILVSCNFQVMQKAVRTLGESGVLATLPKDSTFLFHEGQIVDLHHWTPDLKIKLFEFISHISGSCVR